MERKSDGKINVDISDELASLYGRLLSNLDREVAVQQSLLKVLEEERENLSRSSAEGILASNAHKEALLMQSDENNAVRREIIDRVGALPGWHGKKITLSTLADQAADKKTAAEIRKRQQVLTELVSTIRMQNNRNIELINAAINDVQGALQLIQNMVSVGVNYQKTGQYGSYARHGSLINREG
jgi:flagellar biosynthesis/type III secretory pathway chaperone